MKHGAACERGAALGLRRTYVVRVKRCLTRLIAVGARVKRCLTRLIAVGYFLGASAGAAMAGAAGAAAAGA